LPDEFFIEAPLARGKQETFVFNFFGEMTVSSVNETTDVE
jgi:hypothetical protein